MAADQQQGAAELDLEREKLASKERIEAAELAFDEQELMVKTQTDQQKFEADQEAEGYKFAQSIEQKDTDRKERKGE